MLLLLANLMELQFVIDLLFLNFLMFAFHRKNSKLH